MHTFSIIFNLIYFGIVHELCYTVKTRSFVSIIWDCFKDYDRTNKFRVSPSIDSFNWFTILCISKEELANMLYQKRVPEEIKINDALFYISLNASVNVLSLLDHTHIWREIIKYALLYKRRVRLAFVLLSEDNKGKKEPLNFLIAVLRSPHTPFSMRKSNLEMEMDPTRKVFILIPNT